MSYLLDTNVVSELRKGSRCNPGVGSWFQELDDAELYLSALTVGEIRRGIENIRRRDPTAAAALEHWLELLMNTYAGRVLPVDHRVAERWGRLDAPDPLPVVDGLVAATALVHGLTLATRNTADVRRTGVALVNPFTHP